MKIVHLIDYYQPQLGYQETFLAKEHQLNGHIVSIIASDKYYPFPNFSDTFVSLLGGRQLRASDSQEDGLRVIRLNSWELPGTPLVYMAGLFSTLEKLRPDIVYCHNVFSILSYLAARYKRILKYKLVYDSHAAYFNTNFSDSIGKKLYLSVYKNFMLPSIKRHADTFFAIGEEEQKFLSEMCFIPLQQIIITRLGVDVEMFAFRENERTRIRKKLGISEKEVVFICAGKISPSKNIDILLQSFKKLAGIHCKLILIGGGKKEYIEKLQQLSQPELVIWKDFVPNRDLAAYYSAADIGVWPGDPTITILEAMSCKLPVIIPERYGTRYLDKSEGILRIKRDNVSDLSEKMILLSQNKKIRHTLGKNAANYIHKNLSWEKIAKQTLIYMV